MTEQQYLDYPYDQQQQQQQQQQETQFPDPNKAGTGGQDVNNEGIYKLFVGQIPPFTTEDTLRATFSPYGTITDVVILKDRHTGAHKGCGFVCFANRASADHAISQLADKVKLPNAKREMIVRYAGERPDDKEHKLYVCMLSRQSTEAEVRALFEPYGTLTEVFIIRSREGNQSKGAAFVKYTNKEDAMRAVEAIHDKVKDKDAPGLVQVRFAHTKEERAAHLSHVLGGGHPHPAAMQAALMRGMPPNMNHPYAHHLAYGNHPHHPGHPQHPGHPGYAQHPMALAQNKYAAQQNGYPLSYGQPSTAYMNPQQAQQQQAAAAQQQQSRMAAGDYSTMNSFSAYDQANGQPYQHQYAAYPQFNNAAAAGPPNVSNGGHHNGLVPKDARGPEGANLFVYNVPEHYAEHDLNQLFANFGTVLSTRIQRDLNTGVSKGFGFVSYDDPMAAQSAIHALDGFNLGNKRLTVRVKTANPRGQQQQQQNFNRGGEY